MLLTVRCIRACTGLWRLYLFQIVTKQVLFLFILDIPVKLVQWWWWPSWISYLLKKIQVGKGLSHDHS